MHRHTRSLLSISLVFFFALFLTLSVSPIPLGNQNGGAALADPGSGWEECNPDGARAVFDVFPVDSSIAWASGLDGQRNLTAYKTVDGGETWTASAPRETPYEGICRIFALDENTAWLYGFGLGSSGGGGIIYRTVDGGSTWETIFSAGRVPAKLVALDQENIWMVGEELFYWPGLPQQSPNFLCTGFIERTSDGGQNWVRQYSYLFHQTRSSHDPLLVGHAYPLFDIEVIDSTTAWCFIHDRLIKTESWGWTWDIKLSTGGWMTACTARVAALSPQTAWVAVGGEIKKTSDGGTSWETQYTAESSQAICDITAVDSDVVWALLHDKIFSSASPYPFFSNGRHIKTIDGGNTWVTQNTPGAYYLRDIEAQDVSRAWTAGQELGNLVTSDDYGVVLKTTDGGDPGPDIVSVSPPSGAVDAEVTITGCDFGDTQDSSYVSFGEVQAAEYISWSDTQIAVKVPAGVTGTVQVTVTTPEGASNGKPFTVSSPILPPCGEGSGAALLMLGLTLGLLSLAGTAGIKKRRT